jgi:hypothetical protein
MKESASLAAFQLRGLRGFVIISALVVGVFLSDLAALLGARRLILLFVLGCQLLSHGPSNGGAGPRFKSAIRNFLKWSKLTSIPNRNVLTFAFAAHRAYAAVVHRCPSRTSPCAGAGPLS